MIKLKKWLLVIYRDRGCYLSNKRQFSFYTEPFLSGVGCGGGGYIEELVENAKRAQKAGYKIHVVRTHVAGCEEYPLHPDDARFLRRKLPHSS